MIRFLKVRFRLLWREPWITGKRLGLPREVDLDENVKPMAHSHVADARMTSRGLGKRRADRRNPEAVKALKPV